MTNILDCHPLTLTPLSPIHIGSGDDLDWTRAVLSGDQLTVFDPLRVQLPATAISGLMKAAEQRNASDALLQMQRLFQQQRAAFERGRTGRILLTSEIARHFEKSIGHNTQQGRGDKVVSAVSLARCITNPINGLAIVPGSSLKGALRTAEVARRDRLDNPGKGATPRPVETNPRQDLAKDLLGDFAKSPFARLMVSDLMAGSAASSIGARVRNERRRYKGQSDQGVPITVELIQPYQAGAFSGDIRVAGPRGRGDQFPRIAVSDIMKTCHNYHSRLFDEFASILEQEKRNLDPVWLSQIRKLLAELAPSIADGRAALIRLGKFCSAESKTVAWRSIENRQARRRVSSSSTIWLAELENGKLPLGWALVELADAPSQATIDFCQSFRPVSAQEDSKVDQAPALPERIVMDTSNAARERLAMLEDGYDQGKANDPLLEATIKQSKGWNEEDRVLLARLVRDKARDNNKIQSFKWKQFESLLVAIPE